MNPKLLSHVPVDHVIHRINLGGGQAGGAFFQELGVLNRSPDIFLDCLGIPVNIHSRFQDLAHVVAGFVEGIGELGEP